MIEGGALGWSHPLVIMGFAGAAVIGLLFVWREARAPFVCYSAAVLRAVVGRAIANTSSTTA